MLAFLSLVLIIASFVHAAPTRRSVTALSKAELASFAPFTHFALAAYCPTAILQGWRCGDACNALPGFQPTLIGGDGNVVQIFFVGFWPEQNSVVVAHEGTDPTQFVSVLTDGNILQDQLDRSLFPGVPSNVLVHDGFRNEHALTAPPILAEVQNLLTIHNTNKVTIVGHSLGGALAELDALFLTLNLPSNVAIKAVTFGTPRVGNTAFAQLIDQKVPDFRRINNKRDVVPILPGRGLNYAHPHGEVHILGPGSAVACSGDDDAIDAQCQIATVPNIFAGHILDHLGPYEGISLGTIFCT